MFDREVILPVTGIHAQYQKSTFDAEKFVIPRIPALAGRDGVHVTSRAAAEFVQTGFGIDRVLLPKPVAVGEDHTAGKVIAQKLADFVAFGSEHRIGMVVRLVLVIGTDDRVGIKNDLPVRVAGQ
jgi:hypothetical protein